MTTLDRKLEYKVFKSKLQLLCVPDLEVVKQQMELLEESIEE